MRERLSTAGTLVWISLALAGCASTKEAVLPQDGPSMKAIYEAHLEALGAEGAASSRQALGNRPLNDGDGDLAGYARSAKTELESRFPRLPNPTLVMFVFPHLAGSERVPVPGYATTFPLYERVEYALPGEVPSGRP
jgi:conjugative transfer region lipoprotein (TIGR03751 family)